MCLALKIFIYVLARIKYNCFADKGSGPRQNSNKIIFPDMIPL